MRIHIVDDSGQDFYTSTDLVMTVSPVVKGTFINKNDIRYSIGTDPHTPYIHGYCFDIEMLNKKKYSICYKDEAKTEDMWKRLAEL